MCALGSTGDNQLPKLLRLITKVVYRDGGHINETEGQQDVPKCIVRWVLVIKFKHLI